MDLPFFDRLRRCFETEVTLSKSFHPFSGMQYYLAHAENTVHALFELDRPVTQDAFFDLVADVIAAAPQLLWQESLKENGHLREGSNDWSQCLHFQSFDSTSEASTALHSLMAQPLHDTDAPAFRAICQVINDRETRIVFQTTHALMEGGDVSDLLRGRRSVHETRPTENSNLSTLTHLLIWALTPLLCFAFMGIAAFSKKDRSDFGFARLALNRRDLKSVAQSMGVSQRDLLFALASHQKSIRTKPGKKAYLAYTTRPPVRVHLCDDEFLNVRIDDFRCTLKSDFNDFVQHLSAELRARVSQLMFAHTLTRRLAQFHKALHPRLPWLYPKALWGFAPYDLILSLLPPIAQGRSFALLDGARVFAGSDTGTADTCVFAANDAEVTLSFWCEPRKNNPVDQISEQAEALGIRVTSTTFAS